LSDHISDTRIIAYIGLGSNLGDSLTVLHEAWQELGSRPGIAPLVLSSPYRSEPVGMESDNWFVNAVGALHTTLTPESLLEQLLAVETDFGRVRQPPASGYQDRILDLDLLLFGNQVMAQPELHLPHPLLHERLFVLLPLAEIAPLVCHPISGKRVFSLLSELGERGEQPVVEKISWEHVDI
jgi:2-amino-4-hydroxy-6-hydroxymethyldihydropteridine diphosphokinase